MTKQTETSCPAKKEERRKGKAFVLRLILANYWLPGVSTVSCQHGVFGEGVRPGHHRHRRCHKSSDASERIRKS